MTNLLFQAVPAPTPGKNRIHVDIRTDGDPTAQLRRLVDDLGAGMVGEGSDESGNSWTILADPEGNQFCVVHRPAVS